MSESSGSRAVSPLSVLVVLIAATGGSWYLDRPIRSFRPPSPVEVELPAPSERSVRARLWEDPLAAVRRREFEPCHDARGPCLANSLSLVRKAITDALKKASASGRMITLMPVMIPGGPYDLDAEARLRTRFAILAALAQRGFVQDEWDQLYYFIRPDGKISQPPGPAPSPLLVPYEWFSRGPGNQGSCDSVLVLWLDDSQFQQRPLFDLGDLVDLLLPEWPDDIESAPRSHLRLLGPTSSNILRAMLAEIGRPDLRAPSHLTFEIFSPWATADWDYLTDQGGAKCDGAGPLCCQELQHMVRVWRRPDSGNCSREPPSEGPVLERSIAPDGQVIRELAFDLRARGVDLCDPGSVILISEWDTLYGQSLASSFRKQLKALCPFLSRDLDVPRVVYLMGLDGRLPGDKLAEGSSQGTERPRRDFSNEDIERPNGRSQIDYLRRLGTQLAELESKKTRAIGVLGGDVFDKLLVLQALRPRLPQDIFFTTDLDANFLHPSQRRWTGGLVVAASFGFEYSRVAESEDLSSNRTGDRPLRFRDTYQTAALATCDRALEFDTRAEAEQRGFLDWESQPRVYEIGRTRLFRLGSAASDAAGPSKQEKGIVIALVLFGSLGLALFAWFVRRRKRADANRGPALWLRWRWFSVLALGVGLLVMEMVAYLLQTVHEPFAWTQGVSIWPSALVRSLAALLTAAFLAWIPQRLEQDSDRLSTLFHLPGRDDSSAPGGARWWHKWLPVVRVSAAEPVPVAALWSAYQFAGQFRQRGRRLLAISLSYLGVAAVLFRCLGAPHSPHRGLGSQIGAMVPLALGVCLQIVLTFSVVDATTLCRSLVRQLLERPHPWPHDAAKRWGVRDNSADEALAVDLIAQRTKQVGRTILAPFLALLLIILSRNPYFDRWDWPVSLIVIYGINSLVAVWCSFLLWRAGTEARGRALAGLEAKRLRAEAGGNAQRARHLDLLIERVRSVNEGAFAPLGEQPLISALSLAVGGIGLAPLFELLGSLL